MEHLDSNAIIHVCVVVDDIFSVSKNIAETFGIPEVIPQKKGEKNNPSHITTYHSAYSPDTEWLLSFYKMGAVEIELLQPLGDGPSIWRDFLNEHGPGIHHLGFRVADNAKTIQLMQSKGCDAPQTGLFKGGSYAYINSAGLLGFVLETIDANNPTEQPKA